MSSSSSVVYAQLKQAVCQGQTDQGRELLNRAEGFDLNSNADGQGNRLLHWGAANGQTQTVRMLLDRGALPDVLNAAGLSPLHLCSEKGLNGVVAMLVSRGASLELAGPGNKTALGFAVANDRLPTALTLLMRGAGLPDDLDQLYGSHCFPPLSDADRSIAVESLRITRKEWLAQQLAARRLANWNRRWPFMLALTTGGLLRDLTASALVAPSGTVVITQQERLRRLIAKVLSNKDLLRIIAAYV